MKKVFAGILFFGLLVLFLTISLIYIKRDVNITAGLKEVSVVAEESFDEKNNQRLEKNDFGVLYQDSSINFSFYYPENNWYIKQIGDSYYKDNKIAISIEYDLSRTLDQVKEAARQRDVLLEKEQKIREGANEMGIPDVWSQDLISDNGEPIYLEGFRGEGSTGGSLQAYFGVNGGSVKISYYFNPTELSDYYWRGQNGSINETVTNSQINDEFIKIIKTWQYDKVSQITFKKYQDEEKNLSFTYPDYFKLFNGNNNSLELLTLESVEKKLIFYYHNKGLKEIINYDGPSGEMKDFLVNQLRLNETLISDWKKVTVNNQEVLYFKGIAKENTEVRQDEYLVLPINSNKATLVIKLLGFSSWSLNEDEYADKNPSNYPSDERITSFFSYQGYSYRLTETPILGFLQDINFQQ